MTSSADELINLANEIIKIGKEVKRNANNINNSNANLLTKEETREAIKFVKKLNYILDEKENELFQLRKKWLNENDDQR